jgi:eukaryotic-like serine/threonine-protein kinase
MVQPNSIRLPALAKYEVLCELGHGGMATVYRARDRRLERDVAVKVLHPHLRASSEIAHRFSTEARAVAKLRHPNIVEVYDVSDEGELERYLVVELVSGCTLRTLLSEQKRLPPEVAAAIAVELLHALEHAHEQGVIHRDVKPENVMVERACEPGASPERSHSKDRPWAIKLTDFGIAKLLDAKGVTSTGQVLGSPAHMSPEQIEGGEVDARADVFGVGVLFYECMVGHLPFEGANPAQVLRAVLEGSYPRAEQEEPTIGKSWSLIADIALAHRVIDRYPSAVALSTALETELRVMGFSSHEILEQFFREPSLFAVKHVEYMKAHLVRLGQAARLDGDALAAASHYNRALAYAPNDPEVLSVVTGLQRRSALKNHVLRIAPRFSLVLAVGLATFFLVRAVAHPGPEARVAAALGVQGTPSVIPGERTVLEPLPSATKVAPVLSASRQTGAVATSPKARLRTVVVGSVRPPEGVLVALDGDGARPIAQGMSLPIDDKAHELVFSCRGELCIRQTRNIGPGDRDELVSVALELKQASLVLEGDVNHTFQINEYPNLGRLRAGASLKVPLRRNDEAITITELETGASKTLILRAGGDYKMAFEKP